jgi:tetratricopeptide (TPR) repeat protein
MLGILTLLTVSAASLAVAQPIRAPYTPGNDAEVLQRVPPASDPAMRRIAALRDARTAAPADPRAADALARAYIDFGRKVGDARYAGYAEAVIAPWLAAPDPPPSLLVTQATILQYRHEFDPARALLARATARDATLAQAWLTLASLDMVQGDYPSAAEACRRAGRHGGSVVGLACDANVAMNTGEAGRALAMLAPVNDPALGAWIEGLRAEASERLGRWQDAEAHWRRALAHAPGDNFLLMGYADFLFDRGRPREVMALLADYRESETAYLRLALAHAAVASPEAPAYRRTMAARFAAEKHRGGEFFGREEARYLLYLERKPDAALTAALQNFELQREPADVRLVLEAARAAGKPAAAAPAIEFVARTRLEDPAIASLVRQLRKGA